MPENILVVRNDKLGDFMLAFPALRALRRMFPHANISALVPAYTAEIARINPDVDEVIVDLGRKSGLFKWCRLVRQLREHRFDTVVTLFSTFRIGAAVWLAGIPYRLAPATKLAQVFYNHRLVQRRSRSEQPEYQYNIDLVARLGHDHSVDAAGIKPPCLSFDQNALLQTRERLVSIFGIEPDEKIVLIHPGHGGSANNLSPGQYAGLVSRLRPEKGIFVLVTAGPGEEKIANEVANRITGVRHAVYLSQAGLVEFAKLLAVADVFIGGSTGPLHIAGALDTPTAAFYPRGRVTSALRWQTLNSEGRRLAFFPPAGSDTDDMASIDLDAAAREISEVYLS